MAVTIEHRKDGTWSVSSLCRTKAEAFAKAAKIEEVRAEAFIPVEPVAADPATPVAHHATDAPMPPHDSEAARALIDRHESDDTPEESLNFQRPNPLGEDAE